MVSAVGVRFLRKPAGGLACGRGTARCSARQRSVAGKKTKGVSKPSGLGPVGGSGRSGVCATEGCAHPLDARGFSPACRGVVHLKLMASGQHSTGPKDWGWMSVTGRVPGNFRGTPVRLNITAVEKRCPQAVAWATPGLEGRGGRL